MVFDDIADLIGLLKNGHDGEGNFAEDEADYMRGLLEAIIANRYDN